MSPQNKHSVLVQWSEEDDEFVAFVPELPGCSASADTAREAVGELEHVLGDMLDVRRGDGLGVPEPRVRLNYSGQIRLRMPKTLHRNLAALAEIEGVSLNTLILGMLSGGASERAVMHAVNRIVEARPGPLHVLLVIPPNSSATYSPTPAMGAGGGTIIDARADAPVIAPQIGAMAGIGA